MDCEVTFILHGEPHTILKTTPNISPTTSLNTYLRDIVGMKDTKYMCREGGCGACIVSVTIPDPVYRTARTMAVNSCLVPVLSVRGWQINTVQGIGNKNIGYNPIQVALAHFNGSQCGYCSGGMVMNMHALEQSKDMLTSEEVEDAFGGNLCRCTGYRPIMSAFKSLTSDADESLKNIIGDIEDLKICPKSNKPCLGQCDEHSFVFDFHGKMSWYKVYTIKEILDLFKSIGDSSYRLVAGNTGQGVYKISIDYQYWIDIRSVKELISHKMEKNLVLGANMSITNTMELMLKISEEQKNDFWYLKQLRDHLNLVANVPVRNMGTLAGNLTLKHDHHEFPSDIFLLLETVDAEVIIVEQNGKEVKKSIHEYINYNMYKSVLKSIILKPLKKSTHLFKSYKIMPRAQNAHAYVNAGFLIEYKQDYIVTSARIVYGGIQPDFIHAKIAEKTLTGKHLFSTTTLQAIFDEMDKEIIPDYNPPDANPEFRKQLALNLFYKFILSTVPKDKVDPKYISGGSPLERPLMSGVQFYQTNKDEYPVTQPVNKIDALLQTSGEALYADDMPAFFNELFGVFVLAETIPLSKIKHIDTTEAMKMPGVKHFIDYKNVPGKNLITVEQFLPTKERLFCEEKVEYNGQPIGVLLAETFQQAIDASDKVKVTYTSPREKPEYSLKDIVKNNKSSRMTKVPGKEPTRKGSNTKYTIKGNLYLKGQYYFTMETQRCVCAPTEDGGLDLYGGTQWMNITQAAAAQAVNIPNNKVNVMVRRLGGSYGSKILRSSLVTTACAVAAYTLQKPVRLILPLDQNMKALGKRFPSYAEYEVDVDENGVIQRYESKNYQSAGISGFNEQLVPFMMVSQEKNGYLSDTFKLEGNVIQTDMAGNGYCRAPGSSEGVALVENIMEHIAFTIGKNSVDVRKANLMSHGLEDVMNDVLKWADYDKRLKEVKKFNKENRWVKKGLSISLMNYQLDMLLYPFAAFIAVYAGDGTVTISHGGIEVGQGINTKVIQVCAKELNIPMDMIRVQPSNTVVSPNNFMTGNSVTSEAVCYAIIKACKQLLEDLEPVRIKMNNPSWKDLVLQAHKEDIDLRSKAVFVSNSLKSYEIPGACLSEVTVDILTGEHVIARVDLVEDAGQSISPALDAGQIEGAFIMGLGNYTTENLIYGEKGELLTKNTWTYKVPGVKDVPVKFNIKFRQNSSNPNGVLNSKATGEPALSLSIGVPFAIRKALTSARKDSDSKDKFFIPIDGPYSVEYILLNSGNNYKNFTL